MDHVTVTDPQIEPKGWGEEVIIINCSEYCGKILRFKKGTRGSLHFHIKKHETWFVLRGTIELSTVDLDNARKTVRAVGVGQVVDIPRMSPHQVCALEDTDIMEVSTPHEETDSYRVLPGDSQK